MLAGRYVPRPKVIAASEPHTTFLDPERIVVDTTVDAGVNHVLAGLRETFTLHAAPAIVSDITLSTGTPGLNAELVGAVETLREHARRGR